jgi:DNA-3-methyladenine glycosylase II
VPARRSTARWADAEAHLARVDPRWKPLLKRNGPCGLRPRRDHFGTLVRSIISQQISSRAAVSIEARVRALAGDPHTPEGLIAAGERLREAGVSPQKQSYLLDLAANVQAGSLPLKRIARLDDDAVIAALTRVRGIGRWTAEMFLIFSLNRPDVLPVDDLGIRAGLGRFHTLPEPPRPRDCHALAEPWRPWRTVAMWHLWRSGDAPAP